MIIDELYLDLFIKCFNKGKYQLFTFDIKNSRKMDNSTREEAQYKIIELIERIYFDLIELEKLLDKQILIHDDSYGNIFDKIENDFAHKYDPFILGDTVGITIIKDSIPREVLMEIYKLNKKELDISFEFHEEYGNYETDDYGEGTRKCFRGYAIQILSNLHKDYLSKYAREKTEEKLTPDELCFYMNLVNKKHDIAIENAKNYIENITAKKLKKE